MERKWAIPNKQLMNLVKISMVVIGLSVLLGLYELSRFIFR